MGSKRYLSKSKVKLLLEDGDSPDFGSSTPLCALVLADQVEAITSRTTGCLTFQAFDLAIRENRISLDTMLGDSRGLPGFKLGGRAVLTLILRHPTQLLWSHQQGEMTISDSYKQRYDYGISAAGSNIYKRRRNTDACRRMGFCP